MRFTHRAASQPALRLIWCAIAFLYAQVVAAEPQMMAAHGVAVTNAPKAFTSMELWERAANPAHAGNRVELFGGAMALPAHLEVVVACGPNERCGSVTVAPARGKRPPRFAEAYPRTAAHVTALEQLLKERPQIPSKTRAEPRDLPTLRFKNAGQTFLSKVEYLTFSWGSAVAYLSQYAQDASDWAVGYNLSYEVHGLTTDGAICVSAEFDVGHRLAPGNEDKRSVEELTGKLLTDQQYEDYLSQMERLLGAQPNDSFRPPLNAIHKLLEGIEFRQTKPRSWDSRFKNRQLTLSPK